MVGQNVGGSSVQFLFADHMLDTDRRELHRGSEAISVEPQVLDLLICLVQNRNRVVTKDDLIASVWRGRIVSEATLTSRIYAARKAVGDSGERPAAGSAPSPARACGSSAASRNGRPQRCRAQAACNRPRPLRTRPVRCCRSEPAIAVLPFDQHVGRPRCRSTSADGISEDIITALSRLRWFSVIARNSARSPTRARPYRCAAGRGVSSGSRYVLEGSVRKAAQRVRITAQLQRRDHRQPHLGGALRPRSRPTSSRSRTRSRRRSSRAIEPQIYAAENFRARRKPPERLDAWDLAMRALAHYGRVTRRGQRRRAGAAGEGDRHRSDLWPGARPARDQPDIRRPHGLVGQDDGAASPSGRPWPRSGPTAEDPLGPPRAGLHLPVRPAVRRCAGRVRIGPEARIPNFSLARCYYCVAAGLQRPLAGGRGSRPSRAAVQPARSIVGALLRRRRLRAVRRTQLRQGDAAGARRPSAFAAISPGAHRVLVAAAGMAGQAEVAAAALQELRRAQPDVSLAWIAEPHADQARRRPRTLPGRLPPRRPG